MPDDSLSDDERKLLVNVLTVEIEGSKFPLSPRMVALKAIRAKLRGESPPPEPVPQALHDFEVTDHEWRANVRRGEGAIRPFWACVLLFERARTRGSQRDFGLGTIERAWRCQVASRMGLSC